MKPTYKANLFALMLVLTQILGSKFIAPIIVSLGLSFPVLMVSTQILFLFVPTIIYFIVTKENVVDTLSLKKLPLKDILMVMVIALFCQPVAWFLSYTSGLFFPNKVAEVFKVVSGLPYIVLLFVMAVVPAVFEEITIRGIVLRGYKDKSILTAGLFTGLIFGMLHLNAQQFLYAAALGVLLAYLVRITGSIYSSILCHFLFNGFQVTMSKLMQLFAEMMNKDIAAAQSSAADIPIAAKLYTFFVLAVLAAVFTTFIVMLIKKMRREKGLMLSVESSSLEEEKLNYLSRDYENINNDNYMDNPLNAPFILNIVIFVLMMFLQNLSY